MKPITTLKELLKPPFNWDGFSNSEYILCGTNNADCKGIGLKVYGTPFLEHFKNGKQLYDDFKDFIVAALNEKWERNFGEPLRWGMVDAGEWCNFVCPKCNVTHIHMHDHCPSCGSRLLPPKEAK